MTVRVSLNFAMNVLIKLYPDACLCLLYAFGFGGLRGTTISFDQIVFLCIVLLHDCKLLLDIRS